MRMKFRTGGVTGAGLSRKRLFLLPAVAVAVVAMAAGASELAHRLQELPDPAGYSVSFGSVEGFYEQKSRESDVESTTDSVVNLLYRDSLTRRVFQNQFEPQSFYSAVRAEPRVRKLLVAAEKGTPEERAAILRATQEMYTFVAEKLPLAPKENEPMRPTVAYPDGGFAYPVILAAIDDKAESLPLLVKMAHRLQEALAGPENAEKDDGVYRHCAHTALVHYCIGEFLQRYVENEEMRKGLTPRQEELLVEYQDLREKELSNPYVGYAFLNYRGNGKELFRIATEFVDAAAQ